MKFRFFSNITWKFLKVLKNLQDPEILENPEYVNKNFSLKYLEKCGAFIIYKNKIDIYMYLHIEIII